MHRKENTVGSADLSVVRITALPGELGIQKTKCFCFHTEVPAHPPNTSVLQKKNLQVYKVFSLESQIYLETKNSIFLSVKFLSKYFHKFCIFKNGKSHSQQSRFHPAPHNHH